MKKSIVFAAVIAMVASISALPAAAKPRSAATTSSTVNVTLRLSVGEPTVSQQYKACGVTVASGANGIAVLQAATTSGCISGYTVTPSTWGSYVSCIDGVCETAATYWRMTENGSLTGYGVSGFQANAGDVLGFSHTEWATCLALGAC